MNPVRFDSDNESEFINHVVRDHAFYWRLVSLRLNFFTSTKKPIGFIETASGRRRRIFDKPETPWQRVKCAGIPVDVTAVEKRIAGINPADLAAEKTRALSETRRLDMAS